MSPKPPWTDNDYRWMRRAIELSHHCPPAQDAFSVGSIVVGKNGDAIAHGYSRQGGDPHAHAEETALAQLTEDKQLAGGTIYSTLEPCSRRASRPLSCTQHILRSGLTRVVIAWREPALFVDDCQGLEMLTHTGLTVVEIPELAQAARAANSHLHRG